MTAERPTTFTEGMLRHYWRGPQSFYRPRARRQEVRTPMVRGEVLWGGALVYVVA